MLTGERGHYELAAGNDPLPFLAVMVAMCGSGGMIPEQVWDTEAIENKGLYPGRPSWSAMPLVWAHSEYIKLMISRRLGYPYDRPPTTWHRYQGSRPSIQHAIWLPQAPILKINCGQTLLVGLYEPGIIHWASDNWLSPRDTATIDTGLGIHIAELETRLFCSGQLIDFTYRNTITDTWLNQNFTVTVQPQ